MAPTSPLFFFLLLLFFPSPSLQERRSRTSSGVLVASSSPSLPSPSPSPLVLALFVLGDSTVDSGTNNYHGTLARADRSPYGRDFDTHRPTGRFSNGRIIVDYLAVRLGLPFVPPFLGRSGKIEDMIRGVNYASAAPGILFSSGSDLGQHFSLSQQIQQVSDTFQQFELSLGEEATADLISKSVFYVSIGSNDFIHYYQQNTSSAQVLYLPWEFNQLLVTTMKQALKSLYDKNVRRVVLTGLAPIGCTPHYLWLSASENGECVDAINNVVMEFNYAMRYTVHELNRELPNATFTFCDAFEGSMDILTNHQLYGE
ncbi:GDSL esterase/lipase At5g08460-like [Musa acuminata AAA Group]|uniref:GDSL esterase/lipase At5g08460-like n=1 Tax=Musa acuminata AAA Group TaxID=214697 RepID=UPI0031D781BE